MTTLLPRDDDNAAIPALSLKAGGAHSLLASSGDHYFPAGVYYDISLGSAKSGRASHLAAIKAGATDATLYISEKV